MYREVDSVYSYDDWPTRPHVTYDGQKWELDPFDMQHRWSERIVAALPSRKNSLDLIPRWFCQADKQMVCESQGIGSKAKEWKRHSPLIAAWGEKHERITEWARRRDSGSTG